MSNELPLGREFPRADERKWRSRVDKALKDGDFDSLVSRTVDGLRIAPLYPRADEAPLPGRGLGQPWHILQRVDHPDAQAADVEALHDLNNGATGLWLATEGSLGAYGFGVPVKHIERAFEGVKLGAGVRIEIDAGAHAAAVVQSLQTLIKRQKSKPAKTDIAFGFDPIGAMAVRGGASWDRETAKQFARSIAELADKGFKGPFAVADGRIVHAAGGSEAQELAFAIATAVAYLRALEDAGLSIQHGRCWISFRLAADSDQLLTIAKFRALRKLWARVEEALGLQPAVANIAAETAWRMTTRRDPWVNLLRTTVAAFAAGLGGANAISVLPFTAALGLPDRFARRLARNTQILLLEESHLGAVGDPGAGSGAIADLTTQLASAAWMLFQGIEGEGGIAGALEAGSFQEKVSATRAERARRLTHGGEQLIGTTHFAHLAETPVDVLQPMPPSPTRKEKAASVLDPMRQAEPFERMREASDTYLEKNGVRPKVFLARLGEPADFAERATYAARFFGAGGLEAVESVPGISLGDEFRRSGTRLACLCGSDQAYAELATKAIDELKSEAAKHIYLVGRESEALRKAGVETFIHEGCDMLRILTDALKAEGVSVE